MSDYRVYPVDKNDHIVAVAHVVTCDSDQKAIEKARPLVNGHDVELWQAHPATNFRALSPRRVSASSRPELLDFYWA